MKYSYYPGCSLHATAVDYQMSVDQCFNKLNVALEEIEDWNCCGATAAASEDQKTAVLMAARNLAKSKEADIAVSCNACYSRLNQVKSKLKKYPELKEQVSNIFAEVGLDFSDDYRVKHLLEVICEDIGLDKVKELVKKPLDGLKVVPYYGCQMVRPKAYDHPEQPKSMDELLTAIGAQVVPFNRKTKCCGAALISTNEKVAFKLIREIFDEAVLREADIIAVSCPLCQMNLDAFQEKLNQHFGTNFNIPVVYFTQLVGLSFNVEAKKIGLERGVVPAMPVLQAYL